MTRLPSSLQPLWPLAKRTHRFAALTHGVAMRRLLPRRGARALPRRSAATPEGVRALEPAAVTVHRGGEGEAIRRPLAPGTPLAHWIFRDATTYDVAPPTVLEIAGGTVVGDYGAVVTPGGTLDYGSSEYFGIRSWREHPVYLRRRLPEPEVVAGSLAVLAARGGATNYYHFLLDVLPRFGTLTDVLGDVRPDALFVPAGARYQRELLGLTGLDRFTIVDAGKHAAARADRLLVPSLPNPDEVAPRAAVEWLRAHLPPRADVSADSPRRLYVSRGSVPNTRRLVSEDETWPLLEERGFTRVLPGTMTVQEQIDLFSAAEVIVAPHGAALTNLAFVSPGVRVLELFPAAFVKACFWAILQSIPDTHYRYLVGGDVSRYREGREMNKIQADIHLRPADVAAAVDELLV